MVILYYTKFHYMSTINYNNKQKEIVIFCKKIKYLKKLMCIILYYHKKTYSRHIVTSICNKKNRNNLFFYLKQFILKLSN